MADFSRFTNYTEETSFSEVVYGKDSPLLEVEMNEMQEIAKANKRKIAEAVGDCFFPDDTNYISYEVTSLSSITVTLKSGDIISKKGLFAHIGPTHTLNITNYHGGNRYIFVKLWEEEVVYTSTLKSYGNEDGYQIVNPIRDDRWDNETSRRKVVKYKVDWSLSIPEDTSEYTYVVIGAYYLSNNTYTWNKFSNLIDTANDAAQQSLINKNDISKLRTIGDLGVASVDTFEKYDYSCINSDGSESDVVGASVLPLTDKCVKSFIGYYNTNLTDTNYEGRYLVVANGYIDSEIGTIRASLVDNTKYKVTFWIRAGFGHDKNYHEGEGFTFNSPLDTMVTNEFVYYSDSNFQSAFRVPFCLVGMQGFGMYTSNKYLGVSVNLWSIQSYNPTSDTWVDCTDSYYNPSANPYEVIPLKDMQLRPSRWQDIEYTPVITAIKIKINKGMGQGAPEFDVIAKDYNGLINKPSINNVTLQGNKTSQQLNIEGGTPMTVQEVDNICDSILGGN